MIYLASDHGGYQLKKYLLRYLKVRLKKEAEDLGPFEYNKDDDYPDFVIPAAKKVAKNKHNRGIFICGMGNGASIAANKVKGIRAALGYSIEAAEWARRDNDANVICLAGGVISNEHAIAIVKKFLENEFDGGRHERRVKKIMKTEK